MSKYLNNYFTLAEELPSTLIIKSLFSYINAWKWDYGMTEDIGTVKVFQFGKNFEVEYQMTLQILEASSVS